MTVTTRKTQENFQETLAQVQRLLARHKLVEGMVHKQEMPRHDLVEQLVHKQNLAELSVKLERLHSADIADILEALPRSDRFTVWELVRAERDGEILLEVSDAVRESLLEQMDNEDIVAAAGTLDADELADLAPDLPEHLLSEVMVGLDADERAQVQSALSYGEHEVGALMDFDMVTIRDDVTLATVLRYLRRFDNLPDNTDKLFVTDRQRTFKGVLSLKRLLLNDPKKAVAEVMSSDVVVFAPDGRVEDAANAFERYDLVSAPVLDSNQRVIGRLTVDDMLDVIREDSDVLSLAGMKEEDLFSSIWKSTRNRWPWLAVNICTAFLASRVIGAFEETIAHLVALATLMPIVSGIGGNTGTQTITLIIRGLALGQITPSNSLRLLVKEQGIALVNGVVWGCVLGLIAFMLYGQWKLGGVMMAAMVLNLQVAALVGILVPLTMQKLGRDPAYGSSVLLTATTDSMGFFIFLGLATVFLR
ncbi:Magnesium transporter MgtE [Andreprevotia sp. IGB-42]|uniref:magnesium transporter n=1 Tax=Andreprevotia sp. IGB-42 TaxID=2497473 RepID=UPI00135A8E26|nr:magnesium transporter [Andreprevotia sp. IGB-42]KAF0814709.1 Magnesium transporter MgtE [Andreprevotia sp. IGB-42]